MAALGTPKQIADEIIEATLAEDQARLAAAWAAVNALNGIAISKELTTRTDAAPNEKARMAEIMNRVPELWGAVPEQIFGQSVRGALQQANEAFLATPRAPWATPKIPIMRPATTASAPVRRAPTPPQNVGATPIKRAPLVQEAQSGTRRLAIDNRLMNVLEFAAAAAGVNVVVFSGGQAAKGEPGPRTGSTRHDRGMAADVHLLKDGRELKFTNPDDRAVMASFVSATVAAGATGIGAGPGYMGASGIHIGFGPNGVIGGPVTTWGAGGASANAPDWLLAAVAPQATQAAVVTLQTNLAALGYYSGEIDGVTGPKTRQALNDFAIQGSPVRLASLPGGYDAFLGAGRKPDAGLLSPMGVRISGDLMRELTGSGLPVNQARDAYARLTGAPVPSVAAWEAIASRRTVTATASGTADISRGASVAASIEAATGVPQPRQRPSLANMSATVLAGRGRIQRGDVGDDVRELQEFLNARGIRDSRGMPLTEDGVFGRRTREAVRNYQAAHPELRRDAVIGPRTLSAILSDQRTSERAATVAAQQAAAFATRDADASRPVVSATGVTTAADAAPDTAAGTDPVARAIAALPERYRGVVEDAAALGGAVMAWLTSGRPVETAQGTTQAEFFNSAPSSLPAMTELEFSQRFDPTMPPFEGSSGLGFNRSSLPERRPSTGIGMGIQDVWRLMSGGGWPRSVTGYGGIGSDAAALARVPGARLDVENAFRPHDPAPDPLRLGGSTALGTTGPASDINGVYGATRGAAAFLNFQEQQDSTMRNRFSDAFAPATFGAALSFFPLADGSALGERDGTRFTLAPNAYQQLVNPGGTSDGGSAQTGPAPFQPGADYGYGPVGTGQEPSYQQASDAYEQLTGQPQPSYDPWNDYSSSLGSATGTDWADNWGGYW